MKLIFPIAGIDQKFYKEFNNNKYFVNLGNSKLIDYSLKIFSFLPKSTEYIFICLKNDFKKYNLYKKFSKKCRGHRLTFVQLSKESRSSIHSIIKVKKIINSNEPTIIVHPDAFSIFNKKKFIKLVNNKNVDGAIFGYEGFNPQDSLSNQTGRLMIDKNSQVMQVNEKSFLGENDATCSGIYYFKNWALFEKYAKITLNKKRNFYIGDLYNMLIKDKLKIKYFKVNLFINIGSIEAVNEFNFWYKYYRERTKSFQKKTIHLTNLIPAAGHGFRHRNTGFKLPKPFISINNQSMVYRAAQALPRSTYNIFLFRNNIANAYKEELNKLRNKFSNVKIINIFKKTKGMAITCLKAKHYINKKIPLIISSCDYAFTYDYNKFEELIKRHNPDAMIWTTKGYPDARIDPNSYAYVKVKNNRVILISEKKTISMQPHKDHIVTGTFYFRNWSVFEDAVKRMIFRKRLINNEYFVATAIQEIINEKIVVPFEIDQFISWSLPIHLETFQYWNKIIKKL